MFFLRIQLENDAFQGDDRNSEIAARLRKLADHIEQNANMYTDDRGNLWDTNGNTVGDWEILS